MRYVDDAECQYEHVSGDNLYILPRVYMGICGIEIYYALHAGIRTRVS